MVQHLQQQEQQQRQQQRQTKKRRKKRENGGGVPAASGVAGGDAKDTAVEGDVSLGPLLDVVVAVLPKSLENPLDLRILTYQVGILLGRSCLIHGFQTYILAAKNA